MKRILKKTSLKNNRTWLLQDALLFLFLFLYLWLAVEPRLLYHGGGIIRYFPVFNKGQSFFREFTTYPGGLAEYASAFLSQFFYLSWAGALVITLQAWIFTAITRSALKKAPAGNWTGLAYIPAFLILILYSRYAFYFPNTFLLMIAFVFAWLYTRLNSDNPALRIAIFYLLSIIAYVLIGGTAMLFSILCALYELESKRKWILSMIYAATLLVAPVIVGRLIYQVPVTNALIALTPLSWKFQTYDKGRAVWFLYSLYGFLPALLVIRLIWNFLFDKVVPQNLSEKIAVVCSRMQIRQAFLSAVILLVVGIGIAAFSFDRKQKTLYAVDYYASVEDWNRVLKHAEHYPNHYLVVSTVNRALFHTGQLGDTPEILRQDPSLLLLTGRDHSNLLWYQANIFLDLGYINGAEHDIVESIENYGEQPVLLKKLAIINLVKGNTGTARIYLEALRKTLFHAQWANKYLNRLEDDPSLSRDHEIQWLRSLMLDKDHIIDYQSIDAVLLELLERNPQNKMAYDYLLTCYLLTKDVPNFTGNLSLMSQFYKQHIPQLFEEAIVIVANDANQKQYLQGKQLMIGIQTKSRFQSFLNAFIDFKKKKYRSLEFFPADFKNNYFYYYTFYNYIHPESQI